MTSKNRLGALAGFLALALSLQATANIPLSQEEMDKLARERQTSASFTVPITLSTLGMVIAAVVPVAVYVSYRVVDGRVRAQNGQFREARYALPLWRFVTRL